MAGKGSRFIEAGYETPKPFIDVLGRAMILHVVENLTPHEPYRFIFLARRDHEKYIRQHMSFATNVIYVDEVTEGAACTVLLAKNLINSDEPLVIANSDQLVVWNDLDKTISAQNIHGDSLCWQESDSLQDMINQTRIRGLDGMIATFHATHPKWSYAKLDPLSKRVNEVAEKKVISNNATAGVYYYRSGIQFVAAAEQMISCNIRTNGEFYVCPVFNQMISHGRNIGIYPIYKMWGLGTPEDLEYFNENFYER